MQFFGLPSVVATFLLILLFVGFEGVTCKSSHGFMVSDANGGVGCATCTVIVGFVEQIAIVYNTSVENSLLKFCNFLPSGLFRYTCQQAVDEFAPIIISGLYAKKTPDVICQAMKICRIDPGQPECRLFPNPTSQSLKDETNQFLTSLSNQNVYISQIQGNTPCDNPIFKPLCNFFIKSLGNHLASEDLDDDGFSLYETLRGTNWKGKDCNDFDSRIRPGFKPTGDDIVTDSNCNGIFGKDASGNSYEDMFCKNSSQRGMVVLGDSISAHFHIPEQWFDVTQMNEEVFQHIAYIVENELDWPQLSASTGHIQNTWPVVQGNTSSLYLKLWERNKCNFRDYQNVAVNGARTGAMLTDIVKTMSRIQNQDQPLLVLYSLVGNDVCNGHPDTFDHMTTPQEMHDNVLQTMQYLDTKLPNGSHVLLTGLANGSYLYALLADRIHPIGRVKNDVQYKTFYTYLSCLQVSPCNGWLTTNDTERQMTTDYAVMLSNIIKNVTLSYEFKNFDMIYYDFPFDEVLQRWIAMGGEPWQLLEPVDGFHINQYAHALVAEVVWDYLDKNLPSWLGPLNPFNDKITQIFGDQGGY